jgi:hypothetical protein
VWEEEPGPGIEGGAAGGGRWGTGGRGGQRRRGREGYTGEGRGGVATWGMGGGLQEWEEGGGGGAGGRKGRPGPGVGRRGEGGKERERGGRQGQGTRKGFPLIVTLYPTSLSPTSLSPNPTFRPLPLLPPLYSPSHHAGRREGRRRPRSARPKMSGDRAKMPASVTADAVCRCLVTGVPQQALARAQGGGDLFVVPEYNKFCVVSFLPGRSPALVFM